MEHKGTITITTERLVLRAFEIEDVPFAYANWMSDDKVTEFLRWPTHRSIEITKKVIADWIESYEDDRTYQWAIVLKEIDQPIGSISIVEMDEKSNKVHIGYCIGSKWWHKGYTSEAFAAVISFFFHDVKVGRIESLHDPDNPNSDKVMQKCGLQYEGTLRKADWSNRGIVDACMYGLLAEDFFNCPAYDCFYMQ